MDISAKKLLLRLSFASRIRSLPPLQADRPHWPSRACLISHVNQSALERTASGGHFVAAKSVITAVRWNELTRGCLHSQDCASIYNLLRVDLF